MDAAALREFFAGNDFNALAFTDSRSRYQFYHLARLWQDVQTALQNGLTTLNLTTPARYGGGGLHHSDRQSRLAQRAAQASV